MDHRDMTDLLGAYALDALDDGERLAIEAHLATCAECALEAAELHEAAGALAWLAPPPISTPGSLRERIMGAAGSPAPVVVAPVIVASPPDSSETRHLRRSRRIWVGAVAAAAVVALTLQGVVLLRRDPGEAPARLAAKDIVATSSLSAVPADLLGTMSLALHRDGSLWAVSADMAPAPAGSVYEGWWLLASGALAPVAVIDIRSPSEHDQRLGFAPKDATGFAVTLERGGLVQQPAGPRLLIGQLPTV